MCAPAAPQILSEFKKTDGLYSTILVSIWELGEVGGPLIVAPLAELYGKLPVYHIANVLFIVFSVGAGASGTIAGVIVCRFLNGVAVASVTLNPGIVGDLFVQEQRGRAMSVMSLAVLLGPTLGPVIGGYLSQAYGWRWTFWFTAIVTAVLEVAFIAIFRETYRVTILRRKAARARKATRNDSLRPKEDLAVSRRSILKRALVRPLKIMFLSPIVILLAVYTATVYAYLYLIMTTITEVFEDVYRFEDGPVGLSFLGLGIGIGIGVFVCGATLDWYLKRKAAKTNGSMKPEYRLPLLAIGGCLIPIALFIYGWTVEYHVHWIVPILSTSLIGFGLIATTIPTSTYLVDSFEIYAASAIAALGVWKYLSGALLPLAGPPLYARLGYGWGNSLLGFLALALMPAPLLLIKYGERLRTSSKFKIDL
ncbi:MAG: hypothetical protein Q9160_009117 [Pyrenula sp. 1 TL-2023]